jgi:ATP adenylyltransferase
MERLHSPWRAKYIASFQDKEKSECIFCAARENADDEQHLVITRGKLTLAIMNIYPYNSGHLMIVPNRHVPSITDLTDDESLEVMVYLRRMIGVLQKVSHPDGYNIGSNIGRNAGAGIDQHVHFHIVPRWQGDTNFMPVLTDTKVVSEDIKNLWRKLRENL